MSVKVTVYGADKESDEYQAAIKLKEIINNSVPHSVEGQIVLFASATLMGQAVKDVDLIMIGELHNYYIDAEFSVNGNSMIKEKVDIGSFCTTIEIKRHDISGIFVNGTDFYVYYGRDKHCVTLQSNKQKISAMNFLRELSLIRLILQMLYGLLKQQIMKYRVYVLTMERKCCRMLSVMISHLKN